MRIPDERVPGAPEGAGILDPAFFPGRALEWVWQGSLRGLEGRADRVPTGLGGGGDQCVAPIALPGACGAIIWPVAWGVPMYWPLAIGA